MSSSILRWEDPPTFTTTARTAERIPWAVIASELRDEPGRWGVVYEGYPSPKLAHRIEHGHSPWFRPAGSFEATQRSRRGVVTVYVRYVGEPSPEVKR